MGFDRRFTIGLVGWIAALGVALLAVIAAFSADGLVAPRIVALGGLAVAVSGLWWHVERTNRTVARFLEALRFGDTAMRFENQGGAGFDQLGESMNAVLDKMRSEQERAAGELRYLDALVDDLPVAVLTVDAEGHVTLGNKAARRLFPVLHGMHPEDFAAFGATFAKRLAEGAPGEELLLLTLGGRPQRVLVRSATLDRLGRRTRALSVQPIQGTLDAAEMATQTDLVRVLTHEILNSLTPVTSLAATAADLLADPDLSADPRIADARIAVTTLARRAQGLGHFIEAYRAIARPPQVQRRRFAAGPWVDELARLFAAERPNVPLATEIAPAELAVDADPDLLAQVVINLLKNAGEVASHVVLRVLEAGEHILIEVEDDGPGVPVALRQDIFLPFFTTRASGTGVGLNLARQIVVAHGGGIDVTDAPGGGALFRIIL